MSTADEDTDDVDVDDDDAALLWLSSSICDAPLFFVIILGCTSLCKDAHVLDCVSFELLLSNVQHSEALCIQYTQVERGSQSQATANTSKPYDAWLILYCNNKKSRNMAYCNITYTESGM